MAFAEEPVCIVEFGYLPREVSVRLNGDVAQQRPSGAGTRRTAATHGLKREAATGREVPTPRESAWVPLLERGRQRGNPALQFCLQRSEVLDVCAEREEPGGAVLRSRHVDEVVGPRFLRRQGRVEKELFEVVRVRVENIIEAD